jgi:gamma-glutamyl:cysteine ligase YbdK (ATP-grasp superfamily)
MSNYPIFSVIGIEIEYMLVDKETLDIQPKSDVLLRQLAGQFVNEVVLGDIVASNELVLHVLELKNNGPKPPHHPIAQQFQQAIIQLQPFLEQNHLMLLPTGAHPWMNPQVETMRWPHGNNAVYHQYDSIFNCQGHGWANLQSMHVNLPFSNDEEFSLLHNTIRLLLPLLPALAASTPILDGKKTGLLDSRLDFYEKNQRIIPMISGDIIPEFICSEAQYQNDILKPMYQAIRPFDPQGILQYEWLNSRAAIPKFESMAIEIRILDTQECVHSDIAIAQAIHAILNHWHHSDSELFLDKTYPASRLKALYDQSIIGGLSVIVEDKALLEQWQLPQGYPLTLRDVWTLLIERVSPQLDWVSQRAIEHILQKGNLSERLLRACCGDFRKEKLTHIYRQLGNCLVTNQRYEA